MLVHGGWGGGWVWDDLRPHLEHAGHRVTAVGRLPSVGDAPATLGDLQDDADHLRRLVAGAPERVVLVAHSSGGMAITELADHPNVRHSVYVAALWPVRGQRVIDILGDRIGEWVVPGADGAVRISSDLALVRDVLCGDLEPERAEQCLGRFRLQSMAHGLTPSSAPRRTHPVSYVICELDNCLPMAAQEKMAAVADHVVRLRSAHFPQLSMPAELAEVLGSI